VSTYLDQFAPDQAQAARMPLEREIRAVAAIDWHGGLPATDPAAPQEFRLLQTLIRGIIEERMTHRYDLPVRRVQT
jgi:hypothetical protein